MSQAVRSGDIASETVAPPSLKASRNLIDYVLVAAVAGLGHIFLLLNDGVYWDDWLFYTNLVRHDLAPIVATLQERGNAPTDLVLYWLFSLVPGVVFGARAAAFLLIVTIALLVYAVGRTSGLIGRFESLAVACLSALYPGFQTAVAMITTQYLLYYALFLAGVLLGIQGARRAGSRRWLFRIGSLVCLLLSFGLSSLLTVYLAALVVLYLSSHSAAARRSAQAFWSFLRRHAEYLLAPVVYWLVTRWLFPAHGVYAGYYQFRWLPSSLKANTVQFVRGAMLDQGREALAALGHGWLLVPVIALAALGWWQLAGRGRAAGTSRRAALAMLLFAVVLLGLAMFPYVAIGLSPDAHGWSTRHALLLGLPLAIGTVAVVRLIVGAGGRAMSLLGVELLGVVGLAFGLSTMANDLSWQARWVKDRSVMAALVKMPDDQRFSIFWVHDAYPLGGETTYRFYEWSSMFTQVWGVEAHIGLDDRLYPPAFLASGQPYFTSLYNLDRFDPAGCQADLTIRPGIGAAPPSDLAFRYLGNRLLRPERLPAFLSDATLVQVTPRHAPDAVDC